MNVYKYEVLCSTHVSLLHILILIFFSLSLRDFTAFRLTPSSENKGRYGKWKMCSVSSSPEVHSLWSALQEVPVKKMVGGVLGRESL